MKLLIIGGTGVIGFKLFNHFVQNKIDTEFTYHKNDLHLARGHQLDITSKHDTVKLITKIKPDVVVHATALTNVDLCETNNTLANSINVEGTENILAGCKAANCKIVYLSTSFVFDGKKKQYSEDDSTSPSTYYGMTKFKGEEIVKNSGLDYLILRTDQPYCWTEKWQHSNSVLRVLETLRESKILREIVDWYNTPAYVPDFVRAAKKLLDDNVTGIYHLVGSDFINRYDWSLLIADVFGLNKNMIEPINSDTLNLPAKRVNVNLSNQKLFQKTGIRMLGVKDGLIEMFNNNK